MKICYIPSVKVMTENDVQKEFKKIERATGVVLYSTFPMASVSFTSAFMHASSNIRGFSGFMGAYASKGSMIFFFAAIIALGFIQMLPEKED